MAINRLQAVLDRAAESEGASRRKDQTASNRQPVARSTSIKASDPSTVLVGAHLPPPYLRQLRLLAAEEGVTSNALIREALDLLFVKKGCERIRLG
jgi:hypothetical protein